MSGAPWAHSRTAIELAQPGGSDSHLCRSRPGAGRSVAAFVEVWTCHPPGTADYVSRLLAAFPVCSRRVAARHRSAMSDDFIEPLTGREVQVLELLALRLTDREIADTLVISPFTVRRHIENISEKLGVRGRRALVERARRLDSSPFDPPNPPPSTLRIVSRTPSSTAFLGHAPRSVLSLCAKNGCFDHAPTRLWEYPTSVRSACQHEYLHQRESVLPMDFPTRLLQNHPLWAAQ